MGAQEHETRVVLDERKSVGMEIAKHGVTTPAAHDANLVWILPSEEEGHRATVTKGAGCDVINVDTCVARD